MPRISPVASRPAPPPGWGREADGAFFDALCDRWGLVAGRYRDSVLARRQASCLRALRAGSSDEAVRRIAEDPEAAERALGAVMIGVTAFFRDAAAFESLAQGLWRRKDQPESFRAMSVGCSDGSELYSLAILLAEADMLRSAVLRGMDCRPAAIRAASAATYPTEALAAVSPERARRFFVAEPAGLRLLSKGTGAQRVHVAPLLRSACEWVVADAFSLPLEPQGAELYDLIMCRNLAIYLRQESVTELWLRCAAQLKPGGLLMTGKAERPPVDVRAVLRRAGPCLYRKEG